MIRSATVRAAFCIAFGLMAASLVNGGELKPGDLAPDFQLSGSDGKTYKLADFKDKKAVVIAWFPKAFTGGCTAECKSLRESGEKIKAFHVAYFAASCDPAEINKRFAESLMLDYPILSDPDRTVGTAYGVVTKQRKVPFRWTFYIGKDGKLLWIDRDVKPKSHGDDMAKKLKELGIEKVK